MNKINNFSIVSLGQACQLCIYLKEYKIRTDSFPFDWLRMYDLNIIFDFIKNGNYLEFVNNIIFNKVPYIFYINKPYKILHFHDDFTSDIVNTKEKFVRRFNRLKTQIINGNTVFLRYYMFDRHSYITEFFDNPNTPQEKNDYLDETTLIQFIENDCEYFENYFKNDVIKFIQFIPFKLKNIITKKNCFQYQNNKSYDEQIKKNGFDKKNAENKCYQHMKKCLNYLKTQTYEEFNSIVLD